MSTEPINAASGGMEAAELYCPTCQYDLRGNTSARCPECGEAFDSTTLAASRIPWVRRGAMGWTLAFFSTAWWATFFPQRIAREMSRPVDYQEAQRFRLAVVVFNTMTMLICLISLEQGKHAKLGFLWSSVTHASALTDVTYDNYVEAPWNVMANTISAGFLLWVMTGVHTLFFRPGHVGVERGNRGVALAGYAAGPMAFFPVAVLAYVTAFALAGSISSRDLPLLLRLATLASAGVLICPVLLWVSQLVMLRLTVGASLLRMAAAAVGIPVLWLVVGAAVVLPVPVVTFCLLMMWHSLP